MDWNCLVEFFGWTIVPSIGFQRSFKKKKTRRCVAEVMRVNRPT